MSLHELWPDLTLLTNDQDAPIPIPTAHLSLLQTHSHLFARFGGVFRIPMHSISYTRSILPVLTKTVDLISPDRGTHRGLDSILSILAFVIQSGHSIRQLDIPYALAEDEFEAILSLGNVKRLNCFRFDDLIPFHAFQSSPALREAVFEVFDGTNAALWELGIQRFLQVLPRTRLRRVSFECYDRLHAPYLGLFCLGEVLAGLGWTAKDGKGDLYDQACVVWERRA
ncbi:hypothetical protein HDU98_004311 [Podochytrium sp. JEL0797]|nr:hypothetical protein HDU98_004311 [Podochytrium sp. JEL0797]